MVKYSITLCLFLGVLACVDKQQQDLIQMQGYAQGTTYHISYPAVHGRSFKFEVDSILMAVDRSLSTYQEHSLISQFNRTDTFVVMDHFFKEVFNISNQINQQTDGLFDPTVAPLVNAWGFGFESWEHVDSLTIDSIMDFVGWQKIDRRGDTLMKLDKRVMLDFNAVAQGYTVDVLAAFLESKGILNYMVEVGGEVRVKGEKAPSTLWKIGVDKPVVSASRTLSAVIQLADRSMATSGNYRKFYVKDGKQYSHTIDPTTGYPVKHTLLSATVVSDGCAFADAYATAFMVMGLNESENILKKNENMDGLLIFGDTLGSTSTFVSEGIKKSVKLSEIDG